MGHIDHKLQLDGVSCSASNLHSILSLMDNDKTPQWKKEIFLFIVNWYNKNKQLSLNTSGSTGNPKTILCTKKQMLASAVATGNYFGLKSKSNALLCLPAQYIAGKMMIVRSMALGLNLYSQKPSVCPIIDRNFDFVAMTPMQVQNILISNPQSLELINHLIIGGGKVEKQLSERLNELKSVHCYETFGMTETISHIAIRKINGIHKQLSFHAVEGVNFETNATHNLIITATHLGIKRLMTNDVISLINSTEFLWRGRMDNTINSGGLKIQAEEVEKKIFEIIEFNFFVAGIQDQILGHRVGLIIEKTEPLTKDEKALIFNQLSIILDKNECPKEILSVPLFLYTKTNKVNRNATLDKYGI